jgi:hypothetical protein
MGSIYVANVDWLPPLVLQVCRVGRLGIEDPGKLVIATLLVLHSSSGKRSDMTSVEYVRVVKFQASHRHSHRAFGKGTTATWQKALSLRYCTSLLGRSERAELTTTRA